MTERIITVTRGPLGYATETVDGKRGASSTSPARAAERLAVHLWGASDLNTARQLDGGNLRQGVSRWRITDAAACRAQLTTGREH